MNTTRLIQSTILAAALMLTGCVSPPAGVTPVTGFDAARYMGKWYEVARLDHSFERGLTNVTATYRAEADGEISVRNRGFDPAPGKWREVDGTGKFTGPADVGSLKVKVGAPFYGGYHVIALDRRDYQYAMVSGPTRDYLWILSRKPVLAPEVRSRLVAQARALGFATDSLIFVSQAPLKK